MKKSNIFLIMIVGAAVLGYIRYQRMDIEIARFDYMMRVMKEEQQQNEKE